MLLFFIHWLVTFHFVLLFALTFCVVRLACMSCIYKGIGKRRVHENGHDLFNDKWNIRAALVTLNYKCVIHYVVWRHTSCKHSLVLWMYIKQCSGNSSNNEETNSYHEIVTTKHTPTKRLLCYLVHLTFYIYCCSLHSTIVIIIKLVGFI